MKLSQMTGAELTEALCVIADPIERITQDEQVIEAMRKMAEDQKNNAIMIKLVGGAYARIVPLLLKKHREDTFTILSALTGKTVEQLNSENGFLLMKDIRDSLTKDMLSFFSSSAGMA